MADTADTPELSEEAAALAAMGRANREGVDLPNDENDNADDIAEPDADADASAEAEGNDEGEERPSWLPDKFKSVEDFRKSYEELEKKLSQSNDKDDEGDDADEGDDSEEAAEGSREAFTAEVQTAVADASKEYAETGELSEDSRKALSDLLGEDYVNNYMAGVAALEAKLASDVYEEAGGEDAYKAAIAWADENWSDSKSEKFNDALNDAEMRPMMVKSLMDDFRAANPGEGDFTDKGAGGPTGDLYTDRDEFLKDLAAADEAGDTLARRKATQKLQRSKKAGTLTEITPRTGLGRYNR